MKSLGNRIFDNHLYTGRIILHGVLCHLSPYEANDFKAKANCTALFTPRDLPLHHFGLRVCFMFSLARLCILIYSIRWEIRLQYLPDYQEKWQLLPCWFIFYGARSPSKDPALGSVASVLTLKHVGVTHFPLALCGH